MISTVRDLLKCLKSLTRQFPPFRKGGLIGVIFDDIGYQFHMATSGCVHATRPGGCRKFDYKTGALPGLARHVDVAPVLVNDFAADAQAEAGSLAFFFCREKRFKDILKIFLRDTGSRILDADTDRFLSGFRLDCQAGFSLVFKHRLIGVINDVQQDLLEFMKAALDGRQIICQFGG